MTPDILIIGAGVIGLSIARELHRKGAGRITIIDKGKAGREASFAAAGMLAPQAETDETGDFFDLCVASRDMYPRFAADLLNETGIDIELDRTGTLYAAFSEEDRKHLDQRFEWQRDAGLPVERLTAAETLQLEPAISPHVLASLLFPNDWQVENRRLLAALQKYMTTNGVEVRENCTVDSLIVEKAGIVGASVGSETLHAGTTVVATGAWTSLIKIGEVGVPVEVKPIRGQIVSYQLPQAALRHVIYSPRGYIVPRRDGRVLAGSTSEDVGFDKSVTASAVRSLRETAAEIAPVLREAETADSWAGLRPYANGGLPVMGQIPGVDGLLIATGHFRNGILLAPITAELIAQKIVGGADSSCFAAFGPKRSLTAGN